MALYPTQVHNTFFTYLYRDHCRMANSRQRTYLKVLSSGAVATTILRFYKLRKGTPESLLKVEITLLAQPLTYSILTLVKRMFFCFSCSRYSFLLFHINARQHHGCAALDRQAVSPFDLLSLIKSSICFYKSVFVLYCCCFFHHLKIITNQLHSFFGKTATKWNDL